MKNREEDVMNINIHGSKIDITPAIKDYILEKIIKQLELKKWSH